MRVSIPDSFTYPIRTGPGFHRRNPYQTLHGHGQLSGGPVMGTCCIWCRGFGDASAVAAVIRSHQVPASFLFRPCAVPDADGMAKGLSMPALRRFPGRRSRRPMVSGTDPEHRARPYGRCERLSCFSWVNLFGHFRGRRIPKTLPPHYSLRYRRQTGPRRGSSSSLGGWWNPGKAAVTSSGRRCSLLSGTPQGKGDTIGPGQGGNPSTKGPCWGRF